ncbi:D-alanine--poly(phosphoribitol) ligase subunit DltA [Xylocopilactobacillus apicola]|uniref:D-alanine--D-alanyl carrier protein ligase n=1 Tax=Xylocopilactobacillus apicola TaxID=2932184 RepID=A0AAU9DIC7_9LACO|nr:D-alanine--poly(phosphoribitol) ligase subunit DltA [Xylocopilactobacillus apicola]BDR58126.1 D-alanine--poly(phosphoribitol) ligase subunit 1 [Xylocopilactobacillus apicola]
MIENFIQTIDQFGLDHPERIVYENNQVKNTYGELREYSNRLANYLDQLNLDRSRPVMVYGNQKFETLVAFLGAVKSGHAYIPVDSHSPKTRLELIGEIAEPAALINVEPTDFKINELPTIEPDQLSSIINEPVEYSVDHAVSSDETYYIIFTSGTTGKPKGVQISHNNLLSFVNWMLSSEFSLPNEPRNLSQPPYSFDLSVMNWGPTLASGGTLVALDKEVTDNFKELFNALPNTKVQVWVSTPTFADVCLLNPAFNAESMPEITHFLFCGEELTHKTAQALRTRFPNAHIFNTYGPTEATVAVSAVEITDEILEKYDRLPIGTPKDDTLMTIVNPTTDEVLSDNEKGELIIQGPSVSKGYLNNPEKTEAAFIKDRPRKYRSGDLCARDQFGQFLFYGRTDFQVKLHGYRIELEEVSFHLQHQPLVKQGVVVPVYGRDQKVSQLIAWVVPTKSVVGNELKATEEIKAGLQKEMVSYMVPQRIIYKEELPQSPNGKIDLKAIINEVNS